MSEFPSSIEGTIREATEKIQKKLAETTDFSKLLSSKNFRAEFEKLPQLNQLEIFKQYKDKFAELSKNPRSSVAKWSEELTKNMPNLEANRKSLDESLKQGQQMFQGLSRTFGQFTSNDSTPK